MSEIINPKTQIVTLPNEVVLVTPIVCKNCGSEAVKKFGNYKGVPRFYCKVCHRKFKADDDVFHMKVPSEYVSSALSMYYSGMSVNDICTTLKQEHNYNPSNSVVYKWIDKYTPLATKHFQNYHPQVGDIWIANETVLNLDGEHSIWFYDQRVNHHRSSKGNIQIKSIIDKTNGRQVDGVLMKVH